MNTNSLGLSRQDYKGSPSTLCSGCGHDSITHQLVSALFESSINPHKVAKISGIGCSSKTLNYFSNKSSGFNSIHGRMAPVATGVCLAHKNLKIIGVSGDGDSASIGVGGFCHLLRRNIPMVYIVENNGVYGLTKGQFSATADKGTHQKSGQIHSLAAIDLCSLALEMGCGFVARSFSGDAKQLSVLLKVALQFKGTAFIDVISPCVAFANHEGSTKSYDSVKQRRLSVQKLGLIQDQEEITVDYEGSQIIHLHDGSLLTLSKIQDNSHDVRNVQAAQEILFKAQKRGELAIGLFYYNENRENCVTEKKLAGTPLCHLSDKELRPSKEKLNQILQNYA